MSASTSQNEDNDIEVKIGGHPESTDSTDEKDITKYFAISPEGDFVVEFDIEEFKLQAYIIEPDKDSSIENDQKFSYKKLSPIPIKFESASKSSLYSFKNFKKTRWSIAVSDKLTSTSERLLAISCVGFRDMVHYNDSSSIVMPIEIPENGSTSVFIINQINDNYSVSSIDGKCLLIVYGGIVKLFSKQDHIINQKTEKDKQSIEESSQNVDEHFLILLKFSGIYKYHIDMNKSISNIQKLKYPRRLCKAMINNINTQLMVGSKYAYDYTYDYIKMCLNRHYFLVDTNKEDSSYIELYDLMTNQLVNTFQRQILNKSILFDAPTLSYAISNNNKLLAYVSSSIKGIIIYSIECSLKIAELADIMLLIYHSENEWTVWNIFGSFRDSVKLENPEFIVKLPVGYSGNIERSNSLIIANEDWKQLSSDFLRNDLNNVIQDLQGNESKLDEDYHMLEPWCTDNDLIRPQYSFALDKDKLLLIGNHSIQVWYDQGFNKRSLEFICVPLSYSRSFHAHDISVSDLLKWQYKIIQVKDIKYYDIMNVVKYACYALKYFSAFKKLEQSHEEYQKLQFDIIIKQTRKIILRFIRLHPTAWRLLEFRFGLMNILIETGDYELVNDILSFGESIHIPQKFPWSGEQTTIRTAFS
ncbi:1135_t:CDS:2, partial [Racocetra persica]